VCRPEAPAITSSVWRISHLALASDAAPRSAWVTVWLPSSWPSAATWRSSSGWLAALTPVTKNVAGTWCRRSTSSSFGVHSGSGPSSKVSAIVLSGSRLDPRPFLVSSTGPLVFSSAGGEASTCVRSCSSPDGPTLRSSTVSTPSPTTSSSRVTSSTNQCARGVGVGWRAMILPPAG
jgi:hypothetical protein